jgi:Reverse transcriptase (RNA-dependent DNA polymerase)
MVQKQPCMNILRAHLVLEAKRDTACAIIKYKSRLVADGDAQIHYLDFVQSHTPVTYFTVARVILSIASREDRVLHSPDVSNAFVRNKTIAGGAEVSTALCRRLFCYFVA